MTLLILCHSYKWTKNTFIGIISSYGKKEAATAAAARNRMNERTNAFYRVMIRNDTENPNVMAEPIFVAMTFKWTSHMCAVVVVFVFGFRCVWMCSRHEMHSIRMVFHSLSIAYE